MTMRLFLGLVLVGLLTGCTPQLNPPSLGFESVELAPLAQKAESAGESSIESEYPTDLEAEIEIEDQLGDGKVVAVHEISVQRGNSFLVITDDRGRVLATELLSERSQPVNVVLEQAMAKSAQLTAVLYLDDGDGEFDPATDLQLIDENGELVEEDFYYEVSQ